MAQFRTLIRTDLDRTVTQYRFGGKMFTQDNKANRIDVALYKNNVEIEAEGTVVGIAKRNDNKAVAFPGGIENGRPYIELPEAAYDVEGPLSILIRLTDGEEKTVIGVCDAYVTKTADTDYVTSGHIIVSIQEMTAKLDELEPLLTRLEALNVENVEAISDMIEDTQTALNTVNDIIDNSFMAYVEGDTLVIDPVDPTVTAWATVGNPTDEQVGDAVTDWLDDHPEATTTVEDDSITYAKLDSNLKEKADSVGDLKSAINNEITNYSTDGEYTLSKDLIEQGAISSSGADASSNTRIRTRKIPVKSGSSFTFTSGTNIAYCYWYFYPVSGSVTHASDWLGTGAKMSFENDGYLRFMFRKSTTTDAITPIEYDATLLITTTIRNNIDGLSLSVEKITAELRYIEPAKINGIEFTGNLITYNSYSVLGKFIDVLNGKIRWNNGAYNTYVIPIETGKQYSFSSTNWWAVTDAAGAILDSCGSTGILKSSYDTTDLAGAAYFIVSITTSIPTPIFKASGTTDDSYANIPWLKVTEANIHDLNLISADNAIRPAQLKGASNLGDLIQYYGAEIVTGKFVYGVAGSSVAFGNNAEYKYAVVPVVADRVYKFPTVPWWALTDENDNVVYGCGINGTMVSSVDTSGYSTVAKLYVSFTSSTAAYIIDNDTNTKEYSWALDGLVSQANNNVFAIPSFKHITGKAWNLYFSGGWLRNAEYKRTSAGDAQYGDHFTYLVSNSAPGNVNHSIQIYDNNFDPIGQNTERMTYVNPNYRNLTALFIGDSTINDGRLTEKVLEVFSANNVTCTLLGTTGSGNNKREGRSGWSAADYCGLTTRGQDTAQNPFYNPSTQAFDFGYYMAQQGYSAPDFVFLQLGINDMFSVSMGGFDVGYSTFKANMLTIINSIHEYSASIKIVVNLITMPNGNISAFNTLYGANYYNWERRYVDIRANNKLISDLPNYVLLNPHNLILDPMTNIRDDVHPTADGYAILGEFDANYMFAN